VGLTPNIDFNLRRVGLKSELFLLGKMNQTENEDLSKSFGRQKPDRRYMLRESA
jgi:hypothetical protein